MKFPATAALLLGLATVLGGCRSEANKNAIFARAKTLRTSPEYVIGDGDNVTITVLGHPEYLFTGFVRPDGKISFPRHGDIKISEKTADQVRLELEEAFQSSLELRNPRVWVSVTQFQSKSVTILGQVRAPGRFPYTGQMRVTDLMGMAIDVPPIPGAPNRALLFREIDGKTKVYHVFIRDFWEKADFSTNFYLRPGDIVYVPMNGWAKVATGVAKVMQPVAAILGAIGLGGQTTAFFVPGVQASNNNN